VNDDWTIIDEVLAGLPRASPDAGRTLHVRARCYKALSESRRPAPCPPKREARRWVESALVGGFCAVYFFGVAVIALHTHGLL
jgi:hypothetical protein